MFVLNIIFFKLLKKILILIFCFVAVSERPKHMIELVNSFDKASVDGLVYSLPAY